jgi:fucose 4-O-acetylase-like acetyltransferase
MDLSQHTAVVGATARDLMLDCLKGFAIITVVLGHTFQGATPDFDNYLPFRFVYAFHMPMFMFVSGMTASLALSRRLKIAAAPSSYFRDLPSKALRLIVPFLTWAVVGYFMVHPDNYTAATWLLHVLQFPDNGLWFLWVLFQCSCLFAVVAATTQGTAHFLAARRPDRASNETILYVVLILAGLVANSLLKSLPGVASINLTKIHFIYFFAGAVFHIMRPNGLPGRARWVPYVIFVALVPFWYRTEISPLAALFSNPGKANSTYQQIVAFAGTLAFIDLVRLFVDRSPALLTRASALLGTRSLDVYAIHFYAFGYFPPVIAPIAISLIVSLLLRTNPVTSWLCLGQKPLRLWPITRSNRLFAGSQQP